MTLLTIQNLSCTQGSKLLFENIGFSIDEGEKIALIGINGSGKSTLLKEILSLIKAPNPQCIFKPGLKITYLPQIPDFDPEDSILDHMFRSNTPTARVIRDYHHCLAHEERHGELEKIMGQMDHHQAWDYEARVTSILNELEITDLDQKMCTLSGGMIKKISLAQTFFEDPDIFIMDEPTNHLDIDTISWLESTLKRMNCTLLMVTHDRYFLDKICNKILEIDQNTLFTYRGNYQTFLEQKAQRLLSQQKAEDSMQAIMRVELEWLKRGPKARSTKQKARKQRIETMQNREVFAQDEKLSLGVAGRRLGNKILDLKSVTKAFEGRTVIHDFTYTFKHGEKIGILGPNGTGKTTLLNIISGRIESDSGEADIGVNTVFGYFDQHSYELDATKSIIEHMKDIGQFITLHDGTQLSATKLLERFLFPGNMLKTKIGSLSGGERRRLHLVCMLLSNPNFLLFDEPTNDLDITTLSILEDFLLTFSGCVIVISHDRYFMDRVVDQLLVFKEGGAISHFTGTYSDYADAKKENDRQKKNTPAPLVEPPPFQEKRKLTHSEQKEFKQLESEIEAMETEMQRMTLLLSQGWGTKDDYEALGKKIAEASKSIDLKTKRWDELAEFA